jgi:hypothetical protein
MIGLIGSIRGSEKAVDSRGPRPGTTIYRSTMPVYELPDEIILAREEYRQQHAALEAALDVLDRFPVADADGTIRGQIEAALQLLLRRIWPYLDDLDDSE